VQVKRPKAGGRLVCVIGPRHPTGGAAHTREAGVVCECVLGQVVTNDLLYRLSYCGFSRS
jgi:hypothetical protein